MDFAEKFYKERHRYTKSYVNSTLTYLHSARFIPVFDCNYVYGSSTPYKQTVHVLGTHNRFYVRLFTPYDFFLKLFLKM
jgi:hypothetical protein